MKDKKIENYIGKYSYRIDWSVEDEAYVGSCLEFPSLSAVEDTREDALKEITNVVKSSLEWMLEEGETIPEPLNLKTYSGKLVLRLSPEKHREVTIRAAENKTSINQYVIQKLSS